MVKRIPKNSQFKNKYKQTDIKDTSKLKYNRKQKKYKLQHIEKEHRKNTETKKSYIISKKFTDDGDARKIPSKNRIQNLSKKDKKYGVAKKWKLTDGTIKRRYKNLDIYESNIIYERKKKMGWQVILKIWSKKYRGKTIMIKYISSPVRFDDISYIKIRRLVKTLMDYAEFSALKSDFHIIKIKPFLRYFDYGGGTNG